ncbi:MAG: hypothetical protein Tsb0027_02140 [Wenzhouxiangellaceae bacterium]
MLIDAASWNRVSKLFDQFATLTPAQRQQQLADLELDAATSTWLQKLLAAHDSSDTRLLDQTLNQMAADLIGAQHADAGEIPAQISGQLLGHWRVGDAIARGAMAAVFHGERADGAYEQHVAIKLLQPGPYRHSESEQLREELRLLARLEHPGIARLIDGGISTQGWPYLVMEYVDGVHIDQWCAEQKLDRRQRLQLLLKVCDAVRYAHSKLVVHADLKPSNVLVNRDGEPKLVDFGIASLLREHQRDLQDSHADVQTGLLLRCTPAYAAPEQLRGEPVSTSNDVFGLGALLYELLTGARIRDGRTVTALLLGQDPDASIIMPSQRQHTLLPAGELRGDLDAICRCALAADPQQRYRAVDPLRQDLLNHLQHYPVSARTPAKSYLLSRWLYRHRLGAAAASAVMISLLAGLTVSIRQTELANANARRAQAVQTFLLDIFDAADPVANQQNPVLVNDLLRQQQEKLRMSTTTEPLLQQELRRTLASLQNNLGNHADALNIYQNLLAELPADASPEQRADLHNLIAGQYERLGQLQTALEHAETATELVPLADKVSDTSVQALRTLASIHSELRDNETATDSLEQALQYRDAILALDNGKALLGSLLADLSEKYGMLGDTDKALTTLAEARQWYAQIYPEMHPEQAQTDAREAGIQRAAGDFSQAAAASLRAARKSRQLFGAMHTQSLRDETALAVDLAYLKCYDKAVAIYQQTVARYRELFGENNLLYANALLNLASMRRKLDDHTAALEDINNTLSIYASHGEQATDMQAYALSIKAQLLFALDDSQQALQINTEALDLMRATVGEHHPQYLRVMVSQGHLAARLQQWELAEQHLRTAYDGLLQALGPESTFTRDAAIKLAQVYQSSSDETALHALLTKTGLNHDDLATAQASTENPQPRSQCSLPEPFDLSEFALTSS